MKWRCPSCSTVKLVPSRMGADDARRFCLPCSVIRERKAQQRRARREKLRAEREQTQKNARQQRQEIKAAGGYGPELAVASGMNAETLLRAFIALITLSKWKWKDALGVIGVNRQERAVRDALRERSAPEAVRAALWRLAAGDPTSFRAAVDAMACKRPIWPPYPPRVRATTLPWQQWEFALGVIAGCSEQLADLFVAWDKREEEGLDRQPLCDAVGIRTGDIGPSPRCRLPRGHNGSCAFIVQEQRDKDGREEGK